MTGSGRGYLVLTAVLLAALSAVFAVVYYRETNPDWEEWQRRGTALQIAKLRDEMNSARSDTERRQIETGIRGLQRREPHIIEISPFNGKLPPERCMTCHFGIEDLSASHPNSVFGCVICHGGNGYDLTVEGAHVGLRGGSNPSRLGLAQLSCGTIDEQLGRCHTRRADKLLDRARNVPTSLMATNAGIIGILQFQWGLTPNGDPAYAIRPVSDGKRSLEGIPGELTDSGEYRLSIGHFRKFCGGCHLWTEDAKSSMGRLAGCAACHAPYAADGRYRGCDPTVNRNEPGHAVTHTMTNRVSDDRCRACHNRSARTGMNYHGQMESAQYGTPFVRGGLNDETVSEERFVLNLVPDIHHEKGMGCIDCHTGQDTMGDGTVYAHMKDQIEIRCEDCHGTHWERPKTTRFRDDDAFMATLVRSSEFLKLNNGEEIALTSKGRPMPHVKKTEKGFELTSKVTGKKHPVTVITGKKNAHGIVGHKRLECDTCHSAWSPQCYGCHQVLDFQHKGFDHVSRTRSPGRWAEGRTYFRFNRHVYGINSRGRVGILVPGCQVWNTVVDKKGDILKPYDSKIMPLKNGMTSIAVGPTHPHTTRTEVPRCVDCHLDAKALGFGDGRLVWEGPDHPSHTEPLYDSARSGLKIDYPIDSAVSEDGAPRQSTSHRLSRPFNDKELKKILGIAPCLPCHDRYDDPIWTKPGPYKMAPPCREAVKREVTGEETEL